MDGHEITENNEDRQSVLNFTNRGVVKANLLTITSTLVHEDIFYK